MQDIESYEQTQETMALLEILAPGTRQIEEGKVQPTAGSGISNVSSFAAKDWMLVSRMIPSFMPGPSPM
jgi:hypothetical protein